MIIKLNDKTVVDYTEPDDLKRDANNEGRVISAACVAGS